ncbi:MAG: GNAT family N-acetyltransferase [Gemmatimonadaceae bacterium]
MNATSSGSDTNAPIVIRRAGPTDLTSIAELVCLATERDYDDAPVAHLLNDLRPAEYVCWLAEVGTRPIAMTMIEPRTVVAAGRTWRAGYWTNLFVREEYRATTLYPRLVRTMFREMEDEGLEFLYAAVRRPQVSQAHLAIGMQRAGEVPVLGKPLRPVRLLAKHKRMNVLRWLSPIPDALFGACLAIRRAFRQRGAQLSDSAWTEGDLSELVTIREGSARDRMRWAWTTDTMRNRFAANPDGDPYRLICARDADGRVVAGLVHRLAVRGNDIIAGVILDLFVAEHHGRLGTALLAEAERSARSGGGEVMLYLAGAGPETDTIVRDAGYMRTPETYILMSKRAGTNAEPGPEPAANRWRFSFAEHDAF